eukprot:COSAG01_NODE_8878_length_2628_cov_6.631079_4_plen_41_part_01
MMAKLLHRLMVQAWNSWLRWTDTANRVKQAGWQAAARLLNR